MFGSSSSVYGDSTPVPFREDAIAIEPVSPYAATKRAAELLLRSVAPIYGFRVAVAALLHRLRSAAAARPRHPRLRPEDGRGSDADAVRRRHPGARLHLLRRHRGRRRSPRWTGPRTAPIGVGARSTSAATARCPTGAMVAEIARALGIEPRIEWAPMQPGDVQRTAADLTKSQRGARLCAAGRRFPREFDASSPGSGRPMAGQTERLLARARERFAVQDYYGAVHLLEEIVAAGRAFADVHHLLGVSLSLLGQSERALGEFGRALELNPRYLEALIHQGLVLNELGREREARRVVPPGGGERRPAVHGACRRRWPPGWPTSMPSWPTRTPRRGALERAIEQYRRALELGPTFHDLRYRMARLLLEAGRPLEAREALEEVLEARPNFVDAEAALGLAHYLSGDAHRRAGGVEALASSAGPRTHGSRPTSRCWARTEAVRMSRCSRCLALGAGCGQARDQRAPGRTRPTRQGRYARGAGRCIATVSAAGPSRASGPRSARRRSTPASLGDATDAYLRLAGEDPTRAGEAAEGLEAVARAAERAGMRPRSRQAVRRTPDHRARRGRPVASRWSGSAAGCRAGRARRRCSRARSRPRTTRDGGLAAARATDARCEATAGCGQALLQYRAVAPADPGHRAPRAPRAGAHWRLRLGPGLEAADGGTPGRRGALVCGGHRGWTRARPTGRRALVGLRRCRGSCQGDTLAAALAFQTAVSASASGRDSIGDVARSDSPDSART